MAAAPQTPLSAAETDVRRNYNPRIRLQLLLVKFASFERSVVIADLLTQLSKSPVVSPTATTPKPRAATVAPAPKSPPSLTPAPNPNVAEPPRKVEPIRITEDDGVLLQKAVGIWEDICDELAKDHNHRAQMIRFGGSPTSVSGGILKISFQTQMHLDIGRALLGPLREAIESRIGKLEIEMQIGQVTPSIAESEPDDPAARLLADRWGAKQVQ